MINNRQGGRRRGRGGQRPQGMSGNGGNAARDNRQRGNAAQLLEKYKNLARDAQLAGDRVQTEYYLQFADHYFRVLEEHRARYEDQQPQRRRRDEDEDEGDEDLAIEAEGDEAEDEQEAPAREKRPQRRERPQRARNDDRVAQDNGGERIAMSALPPAIGATDEGSNEEAGEDKPRRRPRRARPAADGEEIAPAA